MELPNNSQPFGIFLLNLNSLIHAGPGLRLFWDLNGASQPGKETCKRCPNGTTTLLLGVREAFGCGCIEGTIDVSMKPSTIADCLSCSEGLLCPDMSTMENLMSGTNPHGERYIPKILLRCWVVICKAFLVSCLL